jgi:hypothetical protein
MKSNYRKEELGSIGSMTERNRKEVKVDMEG